MQLCVRVIINKRSFEPFMCLDLVAAQWQSVFDGSVAVSV